MVLGFLSDKISETHPAAITIVPTAKHVLVIVFPTPLSVNSSLPSANDPHVNTALSHHFSSLFSLIICSVTCTGSSSCDHSGLLCSSNSGIKIKLYILKIIHNFFYRILKAISFFNSALVSSRSSASP